MPGSDAGIVFTPLHFPENSASLCLIIFSGFGEHGCLISTPGESISWHLRLFELITIPNTGTRFREVHEVNRFLWVVIT